MRDSLLKSGSNPKEPRDLRELKAYMLKEFPIGSRVRHFHPGAALGTVQSVDVTFPSIDRSFPETRVRIGVKWDNGTTVDMAPASIDLVEEQQPLFTDAGKITTDSLSAAYANGYAKHAVDYLQKFGNTARCVKAWAFRNQLNPYQLKEAVRAMSKCKKAAADLFPSGIAKVSSTKTAKGFIDDEWREILSTHGWYPSGATEERWTKSGVDYYIVIDHAPEGEPFFSVHEENGKLVDEGRTTEQLEIFTADEASVRVVTPAAPVKPGLTDDIAELKRMGIKAKLAEQHKEVCAWCGKVMREGVEPVSHGICPDCEEKMRQHKAASLELEASLSKAAAMCTCGHPFEIHTHPPDFGCPHENDPDGGCGCHGATEKTAGPLNRALLPAALLALMPGAVDPAAPTRYSPAAIVEEKRIGLDEFVDAICRTEGADPELHNPGNLVGFHSGRIMRFETEALGERALKKALNRIADGQNPNFKPDMSLEKAGLIYSNGDPNWAKNVAKILRVNPKTPIGPLIKGKVKVAGAWGERSYDNDSAHDILDSYRTPFLGGLGKGFEEPVPAEEVKALLEGMDQWIPGIHNTDDLERAFGVMVFLAAHGVKLDTGHKQVAAEIGRGLLGDEDYLNRWKNPLIRKAKIEDELKLFGASKMASDSPMQVGQERDFLVED
jgi:hypothetical protein